ncbi:MAG: hypothetical protein KDA78_19255 [Planctomycetaceae bacterium]|nr:hypothetical protein [Planctomycetaceae bacterium]
MAARKPLFTREELDLRNQNLAAFLSWLIPGAGQFYQRRYVKAGIFFVCILGSFFYGVLMGEGHPVYANYYEDLDGQVFRKRNLGYLSQVLVGAASLPALIQSSRFETGENGLPPGQTLTSPFFGQIIGDDAERTITEISGTLTVRSQPGPAGPELSAEFSGKGTETNDTVEFTAIQFESTSNTIGPEISASSKRRVFMKVDEVQQGSVSSGELMMGNVNRPFLNWYQVPLQDQDLQNLNARLGKRWELAMVLTWIAGLLNILCIWDAYEGPAYGLRPAVPDPNANKKEGQVKT